MTTPDKEDLIGPRHGLRKDIRILDSKVWFWSQGKNLSKREIQTFAKKLFQEAGYKSFQASDGWYRRWLNRWRNFEDNFTSNHQAKNGKIKSNHQCVSVEVTKCKKDDQMGFQKETKNHNEVIKTQGYLESAQQLFKKKTSIYDATFKKHSINNQILIKSNSSVVASENTVDYKSTSSNYLLKKKGERYLPQFKSKVVAYALQNSIKEAAFHFKVNKGTVSDWIGDTNKCARDSIFNKKVEPNPEHEFLEWLKQQCEKSLPMTREVLSDKLKRIFQSNQSDEVINKKHSWLLLYAKRLYGGNTDLKNHIMYPEKFKIEVAHYAIKYSKKRSSNIFNIDRKRIREWIKCITILGLKKMAHKRDASKYVTDHKVDMEIWAWYKLQQIKPTSRQVRMKATSLYRAAGFTKICCSPGWFYRWQGRHGLPSSTSDRTSRDLQLICWVLNEFDKNKSVSHARLLKQAAKLRGSSFKVSTSWAVRFSKKYACLLQCNSGSSLNLPISLEKKIQIFQNQVKKLYKEIGLNPHNLIAVDEIPLNFTASRTIKRKLLLRKSGFENCHASIIISCSADGHLFPAVLILKGQLDVECSGFSNVLIFEQPNGVSDESIMDEWTNQVFLRNIRGSCNILLCDVYKPHEHLKKACEKQANVNVMIIPGGCSSKLQPILFGLAEKFKSDIESQWIKWQNKISWTSDNGTFKFPTNNDIMKWVALTHHSIAEEGKLMIVESFHNAGLLFT